MPITNDDQIDFERVVADPEYRRQVIVYLNAEARLTDRRRNPHGGALMGAAIGLNGPRRPDWPVDQRLRRYG